LRRSDTDWTWTLRLSCHWSTRLCVVDLIFLGSRQQERLDCLPVFYFLLRMHLALPLSQDCLHLQWSWPTHFLLCLTIIPRTSAYALILAYLLSTLPYHYPKIVYIFTDPDLPTFYFVPRTSAYSLILASLLSTSPYHYPKNIRIRTDPGLPPFDFALPLSQDRLHSHWSGPTCYFGRISPYHHPKNIYIWTDTGLPAFYFDPLINSTIWPFVIVLLFWLHYFPVMMVRKILGTFINISLWLFYPVTKIFKAPFPRNLQYQCRHSDVFGVNISGKTTRIQVLSLVAISHPSYFLKLWLRLRVSLNSWPRLCVGHTDWT
jgi:hypothetical protein